MKSDILLSINECDLIVTTKEWRGTKHIQVISIEGTLPYDVITWINILRDDNGMSK